MKVLVYHEASRLLIESELDHLPQPGESFVVGWRELIAEVVVEGDPASILARPATCSDCGRSLGRAYHIGESIPKATYCGACAYRVNQAEYARQGGSDLGDAIASVLYPYV